jgi:hypothetical protein
MMLELRIGGLNKEGRVLGAQSVFPGSTHTSGETIEWDRDGAPVTIDDDELLRQIRRLAVTVMLARHWPAKTARHEAALTVGGFLARTGLNEDAAVLMMEAITKAAGDETGGSDDGGAQYLQGARGRGQDTRFSQADGDLRREGGEQGGGVAGLSNRLSTGQRPAHPGHRS